MGFVDGENPCPPAMIDSPPATGESAASTSTPVPNPAYKAWIKQDQTLLSLLISCLSDEVMHLAVGKSTSKDVWEAINAGLGSSTRARTLGLLGQFHGLRQGESSTAEYLGRAQLQVEDLAHAVRPISLDEQNMFVLRGLRPEYRAMASSLTASGNSVTIPQIADYLRAQEFLHADDYPAGSDHNSSSAFYACRGRNSGRGSGNSGHNSGRGSGSGGRGSGNHGRGGRGGRNGGRGGAPRCQICRAQGHTTVYCYKRYAPQPPAQANLVVPGEEEGSTGGSGWFPDTGATAHATPDASMMAQSDEYTGGDVLRVGNGASLTISRVGHASISSLSKTLHLNNVLHVPKLSVPLLSVFRLTNDNRVFVEFHKDCFIVKDSVTRAVLLRGFTSGVYTSSRFRRLSFLFSLPVLHRSSGFAELTATNAGSVISAAPPWPAAPVITYSSPTTMMESGPQRPLSPTPLAQE
ncbi:PREDICTED: uncharacterized protein LOC109152529 [Ipomoea nil]|uniref:uncharacterized protein LOC109152529 n=1 Tax=Ipomoea nil TaxID=35883 RepID=UPI000901D77E|nr:PREDICTED: uncharacterized protein LOC109152529 [Ipomoea nil]